MFVRSTHRQFVCSMEPVFSQHARNGHFYLEVCQSHADTVSRTNSERQEGVVVDLEFVLGRKPIDKMSSKHEI